MPENAETSAWRSTGTCGRAPGTWLTYALRIGARSSGGTSSSRHAVACRCRRTALPCPDVADPVALLAEHRPQVRAPVDVGHAQREAGGPPRSAPGHLEGHPPAGEEAETEHGGGRHLVSTR